MPGERLSSLLQHALDGHRDFHVSPAHFVIWHGFNIRKPPFDNVLLRYALNMATGKAEIARCFGGGRSVARNIIPSMEGYPAPKTLPITIDGAIYDVLSYNPEGARSLLAKAGYPNGMGRDGRPLSFEILFPTLPHSRLIAEMLQQQWRSNLNVEPKLVLREFNVWLQNTLALDYSGAAEGGGWPDYLDPNGIFDWFVKGAASSCTGYADPLFDQKVSEANEALEPATRLQRLAKAEEYLLRSMPVIPIFHNVWLYLQKPFVGGLEGNLLDKHPFKYAWIDTNWRPS
jgi:oligopeptide transport system substrate-binding protein